MNISANRVADVISTFSSQIRQSKLLGFALFGLAIFHLAIQLTVVAPRELARTDIDRDVPVYWYAAKNALEKQPIYRKQIEYGPGNSPEGVYIYPPPFAAIIAPFGMLPFEIFSRIWFCILLTSFWLYAYCLARLFKDNQITIRDVLIWGLILGLFPGTYIALGFGQVDPLLWALFGFGLLCSARPVLWALAAVIKIFYVWPWLADAVGIARSGGIVILLRRLVPAVVLLGLLVFYGGIVCGWDSYLIWIRDVLPTLSQGNSNAHNVSIPFSVLRLARLLGWQYSGGPLPVLAHLWLSAASIGGSLLVWFYLRSHPIQILSAALAAAAILFSPVCWPYYLPLLLPLVALLFREKTLLRFVQG